MFVASNVAEGNRDANFTVYRNSPSQRTEKYPVNIVNKKRNRHINENVTRMNVRLCGIRVDGQRSVDCD